MRYLPESAIRDVLKIVAGLQAGRAYGAVSVPSSPVIRKGRNGSFHDKGLEGASHHAVIPNVNTIGDLGEIWPRLSGDEKKLFDAVARSYLASVMPDYRYRQTTVTLDARGFEFRAAGRQPIEAGWRDAFPDWRPAEEKGEAAQVLPAFRDKEAARLRDPEIEDKETRPPPRYKEGTLIEAMQNAWRFVEDESPAGPPQGGQGDRHAGNAGGNHRRAEEAGIPDGPGTEHRTDRPRTGAVRGSRTRRSGLGRSGG